LQHHLPTNDPFDLSGIICTSVAGSERSSECSERTDGASAHDGDGLAGGYIGASHGVDTHTEGFHHGSLLVRQMLRQLEAEIGRVVHKLQGGEKPTTCIRTGDLVSSAEQRSALTGMERATRADCNNGARKISDGTNETWPVIDTDQFLNSAHSWCMQCMSLQAMGL